MSSLTTVIDDRQSHPPFTLLFLIVTEARYTFMIKLDQIRLNDGD